MLGDVINSFTIVDKTNSGESIPVEFDGKLREEQAVAATELLNHNIGVLSATTAFGKTVIASYIASQRKTNTLILVHTQALMLKWKKSLEQFLTFDITPPEPQKKKRQKESMVTGWFTGCWKRYINRYCRWSSSYYFYPMRSNTT